MPSTLLAQSIVRLQESMAATRQKRLANAIRAVPENIHQLVAGFILSDVDNVPYAALAAAAHNDAIWDALAQVRQVIVLERGP